MYVGPAEHPNLARPRKPRIGIYEPSRGPSGPSRYVEAILAGVDPAEFDVVLFGRAGGPYGARPGVELVEVHRPFEHAGASNDSTSAPAPPGILRRGWRTMTPDWVKLWGGFGRETLRLAASFRRRPVDLMHTNNTGCEESAVAARLAGVPWVLGTFHVDSTYDLSRSRSGLRHRALECLSNHCLHAAIAVSEATRRDWLRRTGMPARRVVTIHNGVRPAMSDRPRNTAAARGRLGLPADQVIVGGVGRLDRAKGFDDLLDAVAALATDRPHVAVALAGQGPLRAALEQRASRLGIASRVHFLGYRADVNEVYAALDVFVLSSVCEALPYVLLEAMAAGLPVVATTVGGVPEVVAAGETGFLVPPQDPPALAAALRPLLASAELRDRMGRAGRDRVARAFDERETVARTIQFYRDLLGVNVGGVRRAAA
jgi:glycosyltransferase involved in cell wall biosynthesis